MLVLMCFQFSSFMQIDSLTFQRGFWSAIRWIIDILFVFNSKNRDQIYVGVDNNVCVNFEF
jgi:hypothetical protein